MSYSFTIGPMSEATVKCSHKLTHVMNQGTKNTGKLCQRIRCDSVGVVCVLCSEVKRVVL